MRIELSYGMMPYIQPLLAMRPVVLDTQKEIIRIFRTEAVASYTRAISSPCPDRSHNQATADHCGVKMILSEGWARGWDKPVKTTTKIPAIGVFQVFGHVEYGSNVLWCDHVLLWGLVQPSWLKYSFSDEVKWEWKDPFSDYAMRMDIYSLDSALDRIQTSWKYYQNDPKLLR